MLPKEVAQLVAAELWAGGQIYLLIILAGAIAAAGTFLGRYLERKAENYVTREDFAQLQKQLSMSTSLVEGIKSEIQHMDWARREWFSIRSKKLEELMGLLNACMDVVNNASISAVTGQFEQGNKTFDQTMAIAGLYFPELDAAVEDFVGECRTFLLTCHAAINTERETGSYDWLQLQPNSNYELILQRKGALRDRAGKLLREWARQAGLIDTPGQGS